MYVKARKALLSAAISVGALALAPGAMAQTPSVNEGAPGGPLTQVSIGNDLSCQVQHTGDSALELFPSSATPGDCGTFVAVGGTLYTPDFSNHSGTATSGLGTRTPFTAVSQTPVSGSGSSSTPFRVTTVANVGGTGLQVSQIDSYVAGQESYRTDVTIKNTGSGSQSLVLYRAGDCFLQNTDVGFGFTEASGGVGCAANANNSPPGRIEEWVPISPGSNFTEDAFSTVWNQVGSQQPFPNTCAMCTTSTDNGAGISWTASIEPGQSQTFSHFTTFSPTGKAGPPPTTPTTKKPTLKVSGVPSTCTTRNFTARYTSTNASKGTTVTLDGKRVASTKRSKFSVAVKVTSLRRGRHVLRAVATGASSTKATKVRTFSRCAARRRVAPRFTG